MYRDWEKAKWLHDVLSSLFNNYTWNQHSVIVRYELGGLRIIIPVVSEYESIAQLSSLFFSQCIGYGCRPRGFHLIAGNEGLAEGSKSIRLEMDLAGDPYSTFDILMASFINSALDSYNTFVSDGTTQGGKSLEDFAVRFLSPMSWRM